ncbi:hypothetical protein FRB99_001642 [Tulasnella sp. 403]|nr:hypothetical protein FRB99_001642 [Tulasnella sp. 403]
MTTSEALFAIPEPIRKVFARFPLHTHPPICNPYTKKINRPTLWISPPHTFSQNKLSNDVECLKWQAYLALRGLRDFDVRTDITPEAGVDGRLPSLQLPNGQLLGAQKIPTWADSLQQSQPDELEGYKDAQTRDESRAWFSLLEGDVHAELEMSNSKDLSFMSLLYSTPRRAVETIVHPTPAPLSGITSPFPPSGVQVPTSSVHLKYCEAIQSLSERLGGDEWFLGSGSPTALDALLFAYIYSALQSAAHVHREVERYENLIKWETRVRALVVI